MKTFNAKASDIDRKWWVIDAQDQILGNVAVHAANLLRGKNKPIFTPNTDCGDFVVVINAEKVRLSGKKEDGKLYTRYTGYVGGHKTDNPRSLRAKAPERLVEFAVRGMIPHNTLGRQIYRKLKVYAGGEHDHSAQSPQEYTL